LERAFVNAIKRRTVVSGLWNIEDHQSKSITMSFVSIFLPKFWT
jgi:hypothetical protein